LNDESRAFSSSVTSMASLIPLYLWIYPPYHHNSVWNHRFLHPASFGDFTVDIMLSSLVPYWPAKHMFICLSTTLKDDRQQSSNSALGDRLLSSPQSSDQMIEKEEIWNWYSDYKRERKNRCHILWIISSWPLVRQPIAQPPDL
jgi:hypothetical protein